MGRSRKKTKIDHNSWVDTKKKKTDPIPTDIVNEILQRLPAKSVAKFVRVSKSWANIIRSNYFINSFSLRQSMAFQTQQESHRLLFAFNVKKAPYGHAGPAHDNCSFFSSSTSVKVATNDKKPQVEFISRLGPQIYGRSDSPIYLKGLLNFTFGNTQVISNPSTGKSIVLPPFKSKREIFSRYFGFDAIKGEYKVLCITKHSMYGRGCGGCLRIPFQKQILTVGSNSLWREIDVWIPHRPHHSKGVCIDYLAYKLFGDKPIILVRFDVRSEKFLNQLPCEFLQPFGPSLSLINYELKLAIVHKRKESHSFDLWILEDIEKVEWLKISHDVSLFNRYDIEFLGVTPSGENIYTCYGRYNSFYVMYHDHKKNRHRRVRIKANKRRSNSTSVVKVDGFINYVESVMLL